MAIDYCIYCKKKRNSFSWKNKGEGWFCDDHFKPTYTEFAGEEVRQGREQHAKSLLQPYRNGELSREYIDSYGTKGIQATDHEIRNAKPVWKDILKSGWEKSQ